MFARFDENPALTLQVIKKNKKRYGWSDARTDARTDGRTHGQPENSIPHHKQSLWGYNKRKVVEKIRRVCTILPKFKLLTFLDYQTCYQIKGET